MGPDLIIIIGAAKRGMTSIYELALGRHGTNEAAAVFAAAAPLSVATLLAGAAA